MFTLNGHIIRHVPVAVPSNNTFDSAARPPTANTFSVTRSMAVAVEKEFRTDLPTTMVYQVQMAKYHSTLRGHAQQMKDFEATKASTHSHRCFIRALVGEAVRYNKATNPRRATQGSGRSGSTQSYAAANKLRITPALHQAELCFVDSNARDHPTDGYVAATSCVAKQHLFEPIVEFQA